VSRRRGGFQYFRFGLARLERAPVIKLNPAEAAVIQPPSCQVLDQVQHARFHRIDTVPFFELAQARGSAMGAASLFTQMVPVPAGDTNLQLAICAFKDRHVAKSLQKGAMDAFQTSAALLTLGHWYYSINNPVCTQLQAASE
jgi:hypothetical protein